MMLWLLGGAAAIVGGASTARSGNLRGRLSGVAESNGYPSIVSALRSWIPGGGSERATIGPSQLVLINDPTSPKSYIFHENVPPGGHISTNPDGTATIYNKNGQAVSQIAEPWAYDSLGRAQRTWYTVDNNGDLVQHVDADPNALYPILADPTNPFIPTIQGPPLQATPTTPPPPLRPVDPATSNSPAIQALPLLSEPADPPNASTLPPVDPSTSTSPAIQALPQLSEPADPPDPSTLPTSDPSTSTSPAIEALPVLSGTGPTGSRPETISSDGLIWTRQQPDPDVMPNGLPEGQSLWTTTVDNTTITVQTVENPDGTTTVVQNGVEYIYGENGELVRTLAPDSGQAIAGSDISTAVATVAGVGPEARLLARGIGALGRAIGSSKTPTAPRPIGRFDPTVSNRGPEAGESYPTVNPNTEIAETTPGVEGPAPSTVMGILGNKTTGVYDSVTQGITEYQSIIGTPHPPPLMPPPISPVMTPTGAVVQGTIGLAILVARLIRSLGP